MCARGASCSRPSRRPSDRRRALLLIALDDLGRTELRLLGIEAGVAARLALVEQVVAPVELDLDRVQALLVRGAEPPPAEARSQSCASSLARALMWSRIGRSVMRAAPVR